VDKYGIKSEVLEDINLKKYSQNTNVKTIFKKYRSHKYRLRRNEKVRKYIVFLLAVITLAACGKADNKGETEKPKESAKPIKTMQLETQSIKKTVVTNAEIQPIDEVTEISESKNCVVSKINFKNGDRVKVGDIVLVLDNEEIRAAYISSEANYIALKANYERVKKFSESESKNNLESARAALVSARESLEANKNSYEEAKLNYEKYKKLFEQELISETDYLSYETKYKSAKAVYETSAKGSLVQAEKNYNLYKSYVDGKTWEYEIENAKASYLQAKSQYLTAKDDYDKLFVKAKIDGVVTDLELNLYEKVGEDQELFTVLSQDRMKIEVGISGKDINGLEKGSKAKIYVEDLGKEYVGTVYEINPVADKDTKKFGTKIYLENGNGEIKKGMYAKAVVETGVKSGYLVPKDAIVVRDLFTYVALNEDGRARLLKVELGVENGSNQEIISNELKEGDRVVIEGQYLLSNDDLVEEVN